MGKTGWKIRFYETDDYNKTVSVVGNYPRWGSRYDDNVVVFTSIYGVGDYILWYMKKNIDNYDFGAVNLDISLYNNSKRFFQRQYVVRDIRFDLKEKMYVLYGISKDTQILNTPLVDYNIQSLKYDKNRTTEQVLIDVLEGNNILKVQFETHPIKVIDFEYRQLTFNLNDTVYDFIRYIADDSGFEWFVRNGVLYIGHELHIRENMRSASKLEDFTENLSQTGILRKISGKTRPMDILSHWQKSWRCLWAKHAAGRCGGLSKGCFAKRGSGQIDKKLYYQSLEGVIEKNLGIKLLERNPHIYTSSYVSIGNILKDEGDLSYIDQVSVQRHGEGLAVRTPRDVKIDRSDGDLTTIVKHMKDEVSRSSPYVDVDAGLFFPSPKLTYDDPKAVPPNVLIHNIDGREEASVIGNYIIGNGRNLSVPAKDKGDLRLQLPGGWCLYIKENGDTYLQLADTPPGSIPSADDTKPHIEFLADGTFTLNIASNKSIKFTSTCIEISADIDTNIKICDQKIEINKDATTKLLLDTDGTIYIDSINAIKIGDSSPIIQAGGPSALPLSQSLHTHTVGNMGMPVPPHVPAQATTRLKGA